MSEVREVADRRRELDGGDVFPGEVELRDEAAGASDFRPCARRRRGFP